MTLDANWRWTHKVGTYTNCYTGASWDKSTCPDPQTCSQNCALDGVPWNDWKNPYGIFTGDNEVKVQFVTQGQYAKNIGSRFYMLNCSE